METEPKPLTNEELAAVLRKWADVLQISSGPFVNEDLRYAAQRLEALSQVTEEEVEAALKAWRECQYDDVHEVMRAALEAARKART